jgi:hypothetical protein
VIVFDPKARFTEQVKEAACTVALTPLQVTVETPERESDALPVTKAEEPVKVAPFTGEVMEMEGGALSRLIVAGAEAVFPATSVAVPESS